MELHVSAQIVSIINANFEFVGETYTNEFFRLMVDIIKTSILSEKQMMKILKSVSRLYLGRPIEIKLRLTMTQIVMVSAGISKSGISWGRSNLEYILPSVGDHLQQGFRPKAHIPIK